jgi:hypothetical protein
MNIKPGNIAEHLNQGLNYSGMTRSFSPLYSNIGIDAHSGTLYIHYNRQTSTLYAPFFALPADAACTEKIDSLHYKTADCEGILAFYDTDSFLIEWHGEGALPLCCQPGKHLLDQWTAGKDQHVILIQGYFASTDRRDPDQKCAYLLGFRAICGTVAQTGGSICVLPDSQHHALVAVCFACLDFSAIDLLNKLNQAPKNIQCAMDAAHDWIHECTQLLNCSADSPSEAAALSNAIRPLIMNLCKAPGQLRLIGPAGDAAPDLPPGEKLTIGWLRLSQDKEVQAHVVPSH